MLHRPIETTRLNRTWRIALGDAGHRIEVKRLGKSTWPELGHETTAKETRVNDPDCYHPPGSFVYGSHSLSPAKGNRAKPKRPPPRDDETGPRSDGSRGTRAGPDRLRRVHPDHEEVKSF